MKKATGVDTSNLAAKSDLVSLKAEVDKIDIDKLKTVPFDLFNLSNVVDNDVKKTVYDKLVTKVKAIHTGGFLLKTQYNTDKWGLEKKLMTLTKKYLILVDFSEKTDYNGKITKIEGKIPILREIT